MQPTGPEAKMSPTSAEPGRHPVEDPPPILGSWRNLYLLVLGGLLVDILLCTLFMKVFS